jgi:hypothetical protein
VQVSGRTRRNSFVSTMAFMFCWASFSASAVTAASSVRLSLALEPTWHGLAMDGLGVRYRFDPSSHAEPLELDWPTLVPELGRTSDQLTDLKVEDAQGNLPMRTGPSGGAQQAYVSDRRPVGMVSVSYRVPVAHVRPPHRGPHRELQAVAGGLETSGAGVLLLPQASRFDLDAKWDLPSDVQAQGSFGSNAFKVSVDRADLLSGFFLAGRFQTYPATPEPDGFTVYLLGQSRTTTPAFLDWTRRVYEAERLAFHGSIHRRFPLFEVSFDGGVPDSGTADKNGVFLYIPKGDPAPDWMLRVLMAHEMVHVWQPLFTDTTSTDWFIEGTANYLESALPYQAGLISRQDFLNDINEHARDYYTNPLRHIGNDQIASAKWTSPTSWSVPYNRGFFYFADLDARTRRASDGKTTLVDLLLRYGSRRNESVPDITAWRRVLRESAGDEAVRVFDDMLAGKSVQPIDGAFGVGVRPEATTYAIAPAGYTLKSDDHTVADVREDSSEARAGLRAGDVLTGPAPKLKDTGKAVDLPIHRGQKSLVIRYTPELIRLPGFTWLPAN